MSGTPSQLQILQLRQHLRLYFSGPQNLPSFQELMPAAKHVSLEMAASCNGENDSSRTAKGFYQMISLSIVYRSTCLLVQVAQATGFLKES